MTTIEDWFKNGKDYPLGVALYQKLPNSKPNLVRLFLRKENDYNRKKLAYELEKHKGSSALVTPVSTPKLPEAFQNPQPTISERDTTYRAVRISDFPVELHDVFLKKNSDFHQMCSLKIQLNDIPGDETFNGKALDLQLQIDALEDAVIQAWKILDHYTETKNVIIPKKENLESLPPAKRLQTRNYRRSSLSKAKSKLKSLEKLNPTDLTIGRRTKLSRDIEKTKTKILELENDIKILSDLIEGR